MENKEDMSSYLIKVYPGWSMPEAYENFVLSKWLRSFRYGNDYIKLTDAGSYFAAYEYYIRRILNDRDVDVLLAVLSDDPDVGLGFSVIQGKILHYVYVGHDYRSQGIARMLVPNKIEEFTHLTRKGIGLWSAKAPDAVFNPFR